MVPGVVLVKHAVRLGLLSLPLQALVLGPQLRQLCVVRGLCVCEAALILPPVCILPSSERVSLALLGLQLCAQVLG